MPLFAGWITNGTGGQTPVYTNATSATTAMLDYYTNSLMAQQTATATTAQYATMINANRRVWWTNTSEAADWATLANSNSAWASALVQWEDDVEHSQYIALAQRRVVQTRIRTEDERARDEARRAQMQADQLRLAQERAAALARSRELLLIHLTAKQHETFTAKKWFIVEGGKSKQLYRINDKGSYSANIDVLEGKPAKVTHRLCCHLRDHRVPLYDHLLAQKVWIEHDEDDFLRQANRHAA